LGGPAAQENAMKITKTQTQLPTRSTEGLGPNPGSTARPLSTQSSADTFQAGRTAKSATNEAAALAEEPKGHGFFPVSSREVQRARQHNDPGELADLLHTIARDRSSLFISNDATRLERMRELLSGLSADQIDGVRAEYISRFGSDPETNIRSWDFFQPMARLDDDLALEMVRALNGPRLQENAAKIAGLLDKARGGTLTAEDRAAYFSMMPMMGLWDRPRRISPDGANLDAMERKILSGAWGEHEAGTGVSLDDALRTIEAKMPPPDLTPKAPREKSVAVVVSSAGAQWQELMDWATVMHEQGYHIQLFTPDGRPAAFQHDSLCVCEGTSPVGHGCPPHLDPAGPAGELAKQLLANTAGAARFNPKDFGAVFSAGGLGFNEDVVVANPVTGADGRTHTELKSNPNIDAMMRAAVAERLPNISVCHGPTVLAATKMTLNGREESVNQGIETASLPPFEGYVGLTRRKEVQFTYDVNTHGVLGETGGRTSVKKDILNMSRVVKAQKDGMEILTGPGPQAARNLGFATIEAMMHHWR
jgi:putative intracellular protease/amidase